MKNADANNEIQLQDALDPVVTRHLNAFLNNDLEAVVADYTEESVLITRDATYTGPGQIRDFFTNLMIHFPKNKSLFKMDRVARDSDLVYIVWHANTPTVKVPLGTDTFIMRNGKIHKQTFAGEFHFTT
ncbi:MAG: nuclear transport factor 2 family protein [Chitinophagaceae bacterium]